MDGTRLKRIVAKSPYRPLAADVTDDLLALLKDALLKICSQRRTEYERQSLRRNCRGRDHVAGRSLPKMLLSLWGAPPPAEAPSHSIVPAPSSPRLFEMG